MKNLIPLAIGTVWALSGCATTHPLNSQEHVNALVSSFSNTCQKAGGTLGKPSVQGSQALCTTQSSTAVNMYINASFVLVHGDADNLFSRFYSACEKNGGNVLNSLKYVGRRFVDVSGGKEKCETETWNVTHEFVKADNKQVSRVFVAFPRDKQGKVTDSNWELAFSFY